MSRLMLSAGLAAIAAAATPAAAQEMTPAQMRAMLERLDALEAETALLRARLAAAEAAAQEAAPAPSTPTDPVVAPVASFQKDDGWTFKPRGRLQFDIGGVSAPDGVADDDLGATTEIRRARLGVSGNIPGDFGYKFELDFADNEIAFTDAFIDYDTGAATFVLGQHNNFQSLEELTSSNDITFMERAAFTDAFGFERRLGVSGEVGLGDVTAWGGLFGSNSDDLVDDGNRAYGIDGRVVYSPRIGAARLHLGGSLHWRDLDGDAQDVRYRQRPFIHSTDVRFLDTGGLAVAEETSYGLEAALLLDRFHAVAETHWLRPDLFAQDDPTFFGGYAEIGYVLTDCYARGYSGGKFGGLEPVEKTGCPGDWTGLGALQAILRYDRLDLGDGAILGGTQDAFAASLGWSLNDYLRFLVNYARIEYDDAALDAAGRRDYGVDVVGARAQFAF